MNIESIKYFNLGQRSKQHIQKELFDLCLLMAMNVADDEEPLEPLILDEAIQLREHCVSEDRFEAAQAINDMIETYGLQDLDQ